MALLRRLLGEALRRRRQEQNRTLREVSSAARVSLGYLSEVERGQKEASSELLAAICDALSVPLSDLLREVSGDLELVEMASSEPADATRPAQAVPTPTGPASVTAVPGAGRTAVVNRAA
jgi:transcriptional regulator with XRE-family HTH domain